MYIACVFEDKNIHKHKIKRRLSVKKSGSGMEKNEKKKVT